MSVFFLAWLTDFDDMLRGAVKNSNSSRTQQGAGVAVVSLQSLTGPTYALKNISDGDCKWKMFSECSEGTVKNSNSSRTQHGAGGAVVSLQSLTGPTYALKNISGRYQRVFRGDCEEQQLFPNTAGCWGRSCFPLITDWHAVLTDFDDDCHVRFSPLFLPLAFFLAVPPPRPPPPTRHLPASSSLPYILHPLPPPPPPFNFISTN